MVGALSMSERGVGEEPLLGSVREWPWRESPFGGVEESLTRGR
jgi:hypothetical protein